MTTGHQRGVVASIIHKCLCPSSAQDRAGDIANIKQRTPTATTRHSDYERCGCES